MKMFPEDMVTAWLNKQDFVVQSSGEPTWGTLVKALRRIGQGGVAEEIIEKTVKKS